MDEFKRLMGFVVVEKPAILVTPCDDVDTFEKNLNYELSCADTRCGKRKNCIKINPNAPFLPLSKFDVWIVDMNKRIPLSIGYIFYLAKNTLKNNGILVIVDGKTDDSIALSYGFKILYHGEWHYYLRG